MTRIVEKPTEPISRRANIGLYYIKNWKLLYEGIAHVLSRPKNKGEFYLTDAYQYMIDKGAKIKVVDVAGWYDAGEQGTLLDTNRTMLEKGRARRPKSAPAGVTIIDPVYIEDDVTLTASTIGPNVSISAGSTVDRSTLADTIVGAGSSVRNARLKKSLIGDGATVEGVTGKVNVGDHSSVVADHQPG
jgi:glucose-1-phosphate thymidylyltransferase